MYKYNSEEIEKVLIDSVRIENKVRELARQIDSDYADKRLVMVGVLKGSFIFFGDLVRNITIPAEIEFMKVSSYGAGTVSSGNLKISLDIMRDDLSDCDLLIVEDIIDSGRTLSKLASFLKERAGTVRTCTLLDKPERREVDFMPDYCGFVVPDEFVVGYGLDYREKYRTLPDVCVLSPKVYS